VGLQHQVNHMVEATTVEPAGLGITANVWPLSHDQDSHQATILAGSRTFENGGGTMTFTLWPIMRALLP
jgi:hypothetical protein